MDSSRYRGMTEEQLETAIGGLPRREPPPALRARVLAQATPRRAPRPGWAFAALVLLLLLDGAVIRWQDAGATTPQTRLPVVAQAPDQQDKDLLLLVQETYRGRAWPLLLAHRPPRPESYLQLRNRLLNATDRG